jgi:anti-sigma regulatory factor (Ser/Thr protein kinase)
MSGWQKRLRGGSLAARSARRLVRERLRGTLGDGRMSDVELLVSELATNSVRHAGMGDDRELSLEGDVTDERVRVRVRDDGPGFERRRPAPSPDRRGGYGLVLLDRLSDRWGLQRNGGFCVWFEIQR